MSAKSEWKDTGGSGVRAGRTFEMDLGGAARLVVTRHLDLAPSEWKIDLGLGSEVILSGNRTAEEAKAWAERHAIVRLKNALVCLGDTSVLIGGNR